MTRKRMTFEGRDVQTKEQYITITGINYYYGVMPFRIGMKVKCIKEMKNLDSSLDQVVELEQLIPREYMRRL